MKRAEKIALLNRIINGQVDQQTRQQLQRSGGPGQGVIVYQSDTANPGPDDTIRFLYNGQWITMLQKDTDAFFQDHTDVLIWIPDNYRQRPEYDGDDVDSLPMTLPPSAHKQS